MPGFYQWKEGNLELNIKAQPKASKDEFCEVLGDSIKLRITAPPVDGKANQHIIRFLAKQFGVSRSMVEFLSGEMARYKRFRINAPKKLPDFIQPAEH